jgi:hypothetical protein
MPSQQSASASQTQASHVFASQPGPWWGVQQSAGGHGPQSWSQVSQLSVTVHAPSPHSASQQPHVMASSTQP